MLCVCVYVYVCICSDYAQTPPGRIVLEAASPGDWSIEGSALFC